MREIEAGSARAQCEHARIARPRASAEVRQVTRPEQAGRRESACKGKRGRRVEWMPQKLGAIDDAEKRPFVILHVARRPPARDPEERSGSRNG